MKSIAISWLVLIWVWFGPALAQEASKANREEILAVYSFSPHSLTKEQQSQKSKILDAFWEKAKAERKAYLPLLQEQLKEKDVPAFFLYDGSMLLLELSDTPENRRIALQAVARCDLQDVDQTTYLRQVHRLAVFGEDTTDAAFHILDDPKFQASVPAHAFTLGQDFSLIIMLFPTDSTNWLQRAVKRLAVEPDPEAQKSLLYLLWYAQTSESDGAIAAFTKAADKPAPSRDFARQLAARNERKSNGTGSSKASKGKQEEASIRKARVKTMSRISDEALMEFDKETLKLIAIRRGGHQSK
jgi:hypothetical protein